MFLLPLNASQLLVILLLSLLSIKFLVHFLFALILLSLLFFKFLVHFLFALILLSQHSFKSLSNHLSYSLPSSAYPHNNSSRHPVERRSHFDVSSPVLEQEHLGVDEHVYHMRSISMTWRACLWRKEHIYDVKSISMT